MYKKKINFMGNRKTRRDKGRKRAGSGMSTRRKVAIGAGATAAAGAAAGGAALAMRRRGGMKPGGVKALPGSSSRPKALPGASPKRKALPYGR